MSNGLSFSSLQVRLTCVMLVALVPPVVAVTNMALEWRRHETIEYEERALQVARHASAIHRRLVEEAEYALFALAQLPNELRSDTRYFQQVLVAFLRDDSRLSNIGVISAEGHVRVSASPIADSPDVSRRPIFRRALETRSLTIGEAGLDRGAVEPSLTVAYPVADASGKVVEILFAEVNLRSINELATESLLPDGTTVTLFDSRGRILVREPNSAKWKGQSVHSALLQAALASRAEGTTLGAARRGAPSPNLVAFKPLLPPGRGDALYVAVDIPRDAVMGTVNSVMNRSLLLVGLAVALALAAGWLGTEVYLLRGTRALLASARRVREGDLAARTGVSGSCGEINELAQAFDDMTSTLQTREREARSRSDELALQERRFRRLIENSSDSVTLADADATLRYVSPATRRMLGYDERELVGRVALEFIHPEDRAAASAQLAASGQRPGTPVPLSCRLRHKDGSWRWCGAVITNLLDDDAVNAMVVNFRDITARKEAEEQLRMAHDELEIRVAMRSSDLQRANEALRSEIAEHRQTAERLRMLSHAVEQGGDSIFVTDRNGTIQYVNPAFEALTGYSRDEAIGKSPKLLFSGHHEREQYKTLWTTILAGHVFRSVFTNRRKDGQLYEEDQTITPIRNDTGEVTHFVTTGRDVTRRERGEAAVRRLNDQLEQEFVRIAGVLHDEAGQFLTSAHIKVADVARDLPEEMRSRMQEVRHDLEEVERQLRHLSHELHPRILVDLGLVGAIEFMADGVSRRTGIPVTVSASPDLRCPRPVETALYRLAQEALTNIVRHAAATSAVVAIRQDDGHIQFSVCDDGRGMNVGAMRARLNRTGLGLGGIQDRLEAVGGSFEIISEEGRGTQLRATVPLGC